MDLYDFPQLYDALRGPDPGTLALIRRIFAEEVPGGVHSLMDPACGPGNWLVPFAAPGVRIAGNDLSESMVEQARRAFPGAGRRRARPACCPTRPTSTRSWPRSRTTCAPVGWCC